MTTEGEHAIGTVVEWNHRGYGFIGLDDGRRAYVHHTSFGGGNLEVGELVTATIVQDRQNPEKWAAHDVQRGPGSASGPRIPGVVASWNQRGYGFVDVADGRRAYVHATQFEGRNLQEGEGITCILVEDQQNPGKWAAMEVQRTQAPTPQWHSPALVPPPTKPMGGYSAPPVYTGGPITPIGKSSGEERYEGTVTEWSERGFGFIKLLDGRRVYVHSSAFGGGNMVAGVTVNCTLKEDDRNPGKLSAADVQLGKVRPKPQAEAWHPPSHSAAATNGGYVAEAPVWTPPEQQGSHWPEQRVEGRVAQWNERGFGFIELEDQRRAYVHVSECLDGDLFHGEVVTCIVEQDALNPSKWAAKQVHKGPLGEDGVVQSWNQQGGFGFITMDDGRRAYVHISFPGCHRELEVGERLRMITKPDPRNPGKWCVAEIRSDLTAAAAPHEIHQAAPQDFYEIGGPPQILDGSEIAGPPQVLEEELSGKVIEWNQKGYGFVGLTDGRRAYVHYSAFGSGDLVVGEPVTVKVAPDRRNPGKFMVTEMAREPSSLEDPSSHEREWHAGIVTEWTEAMGAGTIELDDGRLINCHDTAGSRSLTRGQRCEALVAPDHLNIGLWVATSLRTAALSYSDEGPAVKRSRLLV